MCYQCYLNEGAPNIVNEKTKKAAILIEKVYGYCSIGGYGHIVFDDMNTDNHSIEFCIKEALRGDYENITEKGRSACLKALNFFLKITEEERICAIAIYHGWI